MRAIESRVGWRLWRIRGDRLQSLGVDYYWRPGLNEAECLRPPSVACAQSPGHFCQCGFWALNGPSQCVALARQSTYTHPLVMGMVSAWGTVAVHGQEGFRAQRARLLGLFTDVVPEPFAMPASRVGQRIYSAIGSVPLIRSLKPKQPTFEVLDRVAEDYGVPLIGLRDAAKNGILSEWGATHASIAQVTVLSGRHTATRDS